jgi:hypothetical protein
MLIPAQDEKKPFEEKYQARDKLLNLLGHIQADWEES